MSENPSFLTTHSWINFQIDVRKFLPDLWMLLGECQSKCVHIAKTPLTPELSEELHNVYLAKGAAATTAIEGNTLTEQDVRQQMEGKLELSQSRGYLGVETGNIVQECNRILRDVRAGKDMLLSLEVVKQLNYAVLKGLTVEDHVVPGDVSKATVGVAGYRGVLPSEGADCLERMCTWLNAIVPQTEDHRIVFAIIRAVLAHVYIAWIHAFGDGNGRTARLLEFQILISSGVPAPAAQLLSNHYNETRSEYYRQLRLSSQTDDGIYSFMLYAVRGFRDGLRKQLRYIANQQTLVFWRDYVHRHFGDKDTSKTRRQKLVCLDIIKLENGVKSFEEFRMISPRVAALYAGVSNQTIARDIKDIGPLLKNEDDALKANVDSIIFSNLPVSAVKHDY